MAKIKFKNGNEAKEFRTSTKEELKVAKDEKRAFEKENKLAKGEDHSADAKLGKKWSKLNAAVISKETAIAEADTFLAENKPTKEPKVRATIYSYPEGATSAEKKKIRAEARAQKRRDEKAAAKADAPAKEKKVKKADAPATVEAEAPKKSKAERKAEKKAAAATTED